jgi:hypothetical protein
MNVLVTGGWVKREHDESGFVQLGIRALRKAPAFIGEVMPLIAALSPK